MDSVSSLVHSQLIVFMELTDARLYERRLEGNRMGPLLLHHNKTATEVYELQP
jgi:hypothetical protein